MTDARLVRLFPEHTRELPIGNLADPRRVLSPELVRRLRQWQQTWEQDVTAAVAQARELRLAVQGELGAGYRVVTVGQEPLPPSYAEAGDTEPVDFPEPPGPYWWNDSPPAAGVMPEGLMGQALIYWRRVRIPDDVLVALRLAVAHRDQAVAAARIERRVEAVTAAWEAEHPQPADPAEHWVWACDREQIRYTAEQAPVSVDDLLPCADLHSLARAIGLKRAQMELLGAGVDYAETVEHILASPLPWGDRAASVAEILAGFPMAEFWTPVRGQATELDNILPFWHAGENRFCT